MKFTHTGTVVELASGARTEGVRLYKNKSHWNAEGGDVFRVRCGTQIGCLPRLRLDLGTLRMLPQAQRKAEAAAAAAAAECEVAA